MKRRSSFLTILTLILAGILVFPTDYADAKKSNTARKSSSKKKKKNKSKKNTETVTVNVAEDTSEARASSSSSRRGGTTTTTTTTTTVVDEATEISNLKSNLLSCLSGQCAGDVSYEKCFKTSNIDVFLAGNSTCQSYLNSASSETVRVLAKQQVVSKVKDYFKESCANAGGKISGETCKLDIYYLAKSPDGKSKVKRDKTVSVGTTFTCSYNNFGLSQQNLEYKAEQSAEDKIAGIQAMIQLGTGLLSTGAQVVGAINAQKNLKRAGAFVEDAWYKFDGTNLTDSRPDNKYWYGASGVGLKKAEEDQCDGEIGVDDNGAIYCRYGANSSVDTYGAINSKTSSEGEDCSTATSAPCWVYIERSNELKKQEKLSELIRTKGNLDRLKQSAAKEARLNDRKMMYADMAYAQSVQSLSNQGAPSGEQAGCSDASRRDFDNNYKCSKKFNETDFYVLSSEQAEQCYKLENSKGTAICKERSNGGYACIENEVSCYWDNTSKRFVKRNEGSGNPGSDLDHIFTKWSEADTKYENIVSGIKTDSQDEYNKALTAYNTNQNSLNTKKKEMEQLKEQSSSALQGAISSGTQTALTGITTLVTSKISADANKGIMTGACYLGDPDAGGSMLMNDGEVKKLNWKLFN